MIADWGNLPRDVSFWFSIKAILISCLEIILGLSENDDVVVFSAMRALKSLSVALSLYRDSVSAFRAADVTGYIPTE